MVSGAPNLSFNELPEGVASSLLLVVAEREEVSRRIESFLRNGGHPMRTEWVASLADIESFVTDGAPDLVLCTTTLAAIPFPAALQVFRSFDADLPVLALAPEIGESETLALFKAGARDVVSAQSDAALARLAQVSAREIDGYAARRELRRLHARMAAFESRHQQLVSGTLDAVVQVQEGIVSHANPAFATLIGQPSADELIGTPLMDLIHPQSQAQVKALVKQLAKARDKAHNMSLTCALRGADDAPIEVDIQLTTSLVDGEQLVEMLIRADAPANSAPAPGTAVAAPLAAAPQGLPDRLAFITLLHERCRLEARCAVAYAVLDDAAQLEQRIGYAEAERLALELGNLLTQMGGESMDVQRFAPYEFALLLDDAPDVARKRLDGLRKAIAEQLVVTSEHETSVTLSVSLAAPVPDVAPEARLSSAIRAAHEISAAGGNKIGLARLAAVDAGAEAGDAATLEVLHAALSANRIKLAYQLIASLEGDTRHHFDVLVRISDEEGHEHLASSFVRTAEAHGLMWEIDRRVIDIALDTLQKRAGGRDNPMMFIKLSEGTLKGAEEFVEWFKGRLGSRQLPEGEVCFEAQELVLQNHIRKGKLLLKALKDLGATIAIEHYGLGSSSVQLLDHIPVTFLKFDKSFTHNFSDRDTQRKMANLMDVAKQRNIKTIVSHVEDANVMARMWQMGVNFIQGYQVQEPEVVQLSSDGRR